MSREFSVKIPSCSKGVKIPISFMWYNGWLADGLNKKNWEFFCKDGKRKVTFIQPTMNIHRTICSGCDGCQFHQGSKELEQVLG